MKNKIYAALDGDSAGSHIGRAVLTDDVELLHEMSQRIDAGLEAVKSYVLALNGQIISAGGDEMTAILDSEHADKLENIRAKFQEAAGFTATMGVGNSLSQAGKSLIAGKLSGKDKIVEYDESVEDLLEQAHQANMEGTANPEQQKMDEHYIDSIIQSPEEAHPSEEEYYEDEMPEDPDQMLGVMDESGAEEVPYSEEEMSMSPDGEMAAPAEEDFIEDPSESDFESEEPIHLDTENAVGETGEEEKADTQMEMDEDVIDDPEMLEEDLSDVDGKEEIMQRIAANLDAFKQNKELMDQIREAKPDLYESILGLLHNMIELAMMIDPSFSEEGAMEAPPEEEIAPEEQAIEGAAQMPEGMPSEEMAQEEGADEEMIANLPKQSGWQG